MIDIDVFGEAKEVVFGEAKEAVFGEAKEAVLVADVPAEKF